MGVEEHHKIETKLLVGNEYDKVLARLKTDSRLAEFELGSPVEYEFTDDYHDTDTLDLSRGKCYVRLRKQGDQAVATLRRYQLEDDNQMIDTMQIKHPADQESIRRIVDYLAEERLIPRPRNMNYLANTPRDALVTVGLKPKLTLRTQRIVFPVSDRGRKFGSIKLDRVEFQSAERTYQHCELEISTSHNEDIIRLQAAAYVLMGKFGLQSTSQPKYEIGLKLIRGELVDNRSMPHSSALLPIYARNESSFLMALERQAKRLAKRDFMIFGALWLIATLSMIAGTYTFSWNAIEPWTYFLEIVLAMAGYFYFCITTKSLTPDGIYKGLIKRYKHRLEIEFGYTS